MKTRSTNTSSATVLAVRPSFVNDDYEYLINCTDLITTCQEALQENDGHPYHSASSSPQQLELSSKTNCQQLVNCDQHDLSSIRAPSSAASSGLGLSLEEDLSLKYCQSDEEFSSLNSTITMNNEPSTTTSTTTGSYTAKALVAEFIEWLDYIENQLDSVCYCAKIAQDANGDNDDGDEEEEEQEENELLDNKPKTKCEINNNQNSMPATKNKSSVIRSPHNSFQQSTNLQHKHIQDVSNDNNNDEVEELMMSMNPINNSDCEPIVILSQNSDENKYNNATSGVLTSFQMLSTSSKANLCLLPETMADWNVILARHESYQNEFEKSAHQFFKNINQLTKPGAGGNFGTSGGSSSGLITTSTSTLSRSIKQQKNRCLNLWIKSLEYLIILKNHSSKRCPRHYFASNKSLLNGINVDSVNELPSIVHHRHHHHHQQQHILLSGNRSQTESAIVNRSYSNLFSQKYSPISDSPQTRHLFVSSANLNPSSSLKTSNKRVELKSTGTGGSSVIIQNRRVQTRFDQTTISNTTMIEQSDSLICDTHSLDGSGSPGADSGVFSSSMENSKYEIIQKDIGYSSDADMSDAIEAQPQSSDQSSLQRSSRKRQVRRRRTRTSRNRPWSFHSDWTAWDYYQTPFFCSGEHFSNEDLNYDNENIVRKLTEFGENYESWINTELDTDTDLRDMKPSVVIEKPEIEAYCEEQQQPVKIVGRADACVATSPIPFLDKECQVIDEQEDNNNLLEDGSKLLKRNSKDKSTQTKAKTVTDSACMPMSRSPSPEPPKTSIVPAITTNRMVATTSTTTCTCDGSTSNSSSYSSIKFYTSVALAGLLSFLIAVTQFTPEIHKTYPRPPPL